MKCIYLFIVLHLLFVASVYPHVEYKRPACNADSQDEACVPETDKNHYNGVYDYHSDFEHQLSKCNADEQSELCVNSVLELGLKLPKWIEKILKELEDALKKREPKVACGSCKMLVPLIKHLPGFMIEGLATELCHLLHDINQEMTPVVCKGIVPQFKDEVLTLMDILPAEEFCECMLSLASMSCGHECNHGGLWTIELPKTQKPPLKKPELPKAGDPVLHILHLSDLHVDAKYTPGSNPLCEEPVCCRDKSQKHGSSGAGFWGDFKGKCDVPKRTFESLLQHVMKTHKVDVIYWTGDLPARYVWEQSQDDVEDLMDYFMEQIRNYFPGVPLYCTLGNHEGQPVNSFPPPSLNNVLKKKDTTDWLYETAVKYWKKWLPVETWKTIARGGYFAVRVHSGLKLISLQTNYCNNFNWWLWLNSTDPAGQLEWLVNELQMSENNREKVEEDSSAL